MLEISHLAYKSGTLDIKKKRKETAGKRMVIFVYRLEGAAPGDIFTHISPLAIHWLGDRFCFHLAAEHRHAREEALMATLQYIRNQ